MTEEAQVNMTETPAPETGATEGAAAGTEQAAPAAEAAAEADPVKEASASDDLHAAVKSTGEAFKTAVDGVKEAVAAKGGLTAEIEADFAAIRDFVEQSYEKIKAHL